MSLSPHNDPNRDVTWRKWRSKFQLQTLKNDEVQFGRFKSTFPSVLWVPNRAQERAFSVWYEEPYPRIELITFGNGTGKTDFLGEMLCGIVKGKEWVNPVFCDCKIFDEIKEKRDKGTLTVWWVCDADLIKKNSPDYKAIKKHIPDAKFSGGDNKGVYHEIQIPVATSDGRSIVITVQVKTHGQDTGSYAGETVDFIICDEPPPEAHWAEITGRLRSIVGEVGARVIIGGTPLKISGYLFDIVEDPEFKGELVHLEGSTWENCHGKELPESEALRLGVSVDPQTGWYMTRGHLTLESIRLQIALWSKSKDPMELASRIDGKFSHVVGRIYKIMDRAVHVVKAYSVPIGYPAIQIMDPHDARPDASAWFMVTPRNKLVWVMEYPTSPYELFYSRTEDIAETCDTWRIMEAGLGEGVKVVARFGDPNKLLDPDPNTKKTMRQLYAANGFMFNTNVTDKLSYGHELVRQMLWFDGPRRAQFPGEPMYEPQMLFFDTCENLINYMIKYSSVVPKDLSKSFNENPDDKFKDFPDLVRYAAVIFKPFEYWTTLKYNKDNEWNAIKAAREPFPEKESIFKGRQVVGADRFSMPGIFK